MNNFIAPIHNPAFNNMLYRLLGANMTDRFLRKIDQQQEITRVNFIEELSHVMPGKTPEEQRAQAYNLVEQAERKDDSHPQFRKTTTQLKGAKTNPSTSANYNFG